MRSSANRRSYRKSEKGEEGEAGAGLGAGSAAAAPTEDVPLLSSASQNLNYHSASGGGGGAQSGIRERRRSPKTTPRMEQDNGGVGGYGTHSAADKQPNANYVMYNEQQQQQQQGANRSRSRLSGGGGSEAPAQHPSLSHHQYLSHEQQQYEGGQQVQYYVDSSGGGSKSGQEPVIPSGPLLEQVNEEVIAVRRAALTVFSPLTFTWLIITIGFSTTIGLGMARWTNILPDIPYWMILLPSWLSHVGLLCCHVMSAKALSTFIAEANENRQRQDSTDHLDRTEYLPLLQRSLKFGLKTGLLSFCIFIFELLVYLRLIRDNMSLGAALTPIWIIVVVGVVDGIICKTQHLIRVICWVLLFASMVLAVLKVDHGYGNIGWRIVISPIVAMLSISSATLIYIVYGHQVGYFRLSESQLTAGILYSMATLICILLVAAMSEVIPNVSPEFSDMRMYVVGLAPLVMALVGLGGWAVSRDEFERLLQFGGQAAVHPMKLRLERLGWTAVETEGVTTIPMFGEVSYAPLDSSKSDGLEMCACCSCYPYEEEDELPLHNTDNRLGTNPYMSSVSSQISGQTGEAAANPNVVL